MTALTCALACFVAYLVLAQPPTYEWQPAPASSSIRP